MDNKDQVTFERVYMLINDMRKEAGETRKEINQNIRDLAQQFSNLESGRLTNNEREISNIKADVANIRGQATMLPVIISVALGAFSIIINFVLTRIK